jgi:hypothetical protein
LFRLAAVRCFGVPPVDLRGDARVGADSEEEGGDVYQYEGSVEAAGEQGVWENENEYVRNDDTYL